ncbi:hypothetical protein M422DRAFT_230863 [Sphaerobolus stellatus SS14]|uniref:Ribosome recycling factor domain-containing protein n=1 Tax=Sphaerobolus stellatus (strain SS14) TaxID=990650 RepID=A0A0C9UVY3_SPHS4|nr:hypothetical protein M422DRAFT_230863 [Sphaerobolus stellatus SS14]
MLSTLALSRTAFVRTSLRAAQGTSNSGLSLALVRAYAKASKNKNNKKEKEEPPVRPEKVGPKGSHATSTANLIPSSKRAFQDDLTQAEYDNASTKMGLSVEWSRKEAAALTARGVGLVTPSILDSVRVSLPDADKDSRIQELGTIGMREGNNLIITLFEDHYVKHVEKAVYAAKIPNVVPQKVDARTIKVVIPKPTMEARTQLAVGAAKIAEEARIQIRKTRDAVVRKYKWKPRTDEVELEQFQKLVDNRIKEVDQVLAKAKQELAK